MSQLPNIVGSETDVRVLICRDCCCGTEWKHPMTDHDEQVDAISAVARARVVGCVNECAYSNVVIVRSGHGQTVWLGGIDNPAVTSALCEWLSAGASHPPPQVLQSRLIAHRTGEPCEIRLPSTSRR